MVYAWVLVKAVSPRVVLGGLVALQSLFCVAVQ